MARMAGAGHEDTALYWWRGHDLWVFTAGCRALSAGQERRVYDAVVLKVLGATRRRVLAAYVAEYGLLGLIAAVFAALIGSAVALVVVTRVMRADFVLDPGVLALTLAGSAVATVVLGLAGTWNALGRKAGPLLRNE